MDIDGLYYDSIDLLKQLISCPSYSGEEDGVATLLCNYLMSRSVPFRRKGNNVWTISPDFDSTKPVILLNSHLDTVRPVAGWSMDPFIPYESEGRLFGLGSNDAGASLVSLLHAYMALLYRKQAYNIIFLASCEEEISGKGGIETVLPELPPIKFALVGEPTALHPAVAEKGLMVLDCTVHGQSGHAARDEGVNAIYKAISSIQWFQNYQFPLKSDLLGKVKMSVTLINAGTQHNVVPDLCTFTVDVRTNECYTNSQLFDLIREYCVCEIKARSFRLNSSGISLEHPVVQRTVLSGKIPFGSPTLSDQALMPFLSLKMGPGESSRSHTADEFIRPEEIREAIDFYFQVLDGLILDC